jgi:hypothetical protein
MKNRLDLGEDSGLKDLSIEVADDLRKSSLNLVMVSVPHL